MTEPVSRRAIADALIAQSMTDELDTSALKAELGQLEAEVELESIDVSEAAIQVEPENRFSGEATAYVLLRSMRNFEVGEEVPVRFTGKVEPSGRLNFETLKADLSPFSE